MRAAWVAGATGLLLAASAAGAAPQRALTVRVTMTSAACRAAPAVVEPGTTVFSVANRARRARLFTIAGRRSVYIRPRRTGKLQVSLARGGTYRYFCISRGRVRNPRTGVLAVRRSRAPSGPLPEHRIAVRPAGAVLELYDRATNERFVPRGNNYVRLSEEAGAGLHHSTFSVGAYEGGRAELALARMNNQGYNTVRAFLSGDCPNACVGDRMRGISAPYAANVADFLRRAKSHGLFVIVTIDHVPVATRYAKLLETQPRDLVDGENLNFLTTGGLQANTDFWHDFAAELVRQRAPTDVILGYELRNEAYFDGASKPFTLSSGLLRPPNGRSYDLARQADRRALVDESLRFWIDQVRSAIRLADPTALVAVGFFEPQEPNPSRPGDSRIIRTRAAIRDSTADFVDIHLYPRVRLTVAQYMQNFGIDGTESKPVIVGEIGAFRSALPKLEEVPRVLQAWQREACSYGIDGWLTWTWDTDEQAELWNALSGGGLIERALAPSSRPDPCAPPTGAQTGP